MISFIGLCLALYAGYLLRSKVRLLQWLYLPSSVLGGLLALVVIQVAEHRGHPLPEEWTAGWDALPGLLINVVFACLFLGHPLPRVRDLWRRAGPQLAYGQVVAWGQYVVGVGLVLVLLGPLFGVGPMFGGLIPVGFEGGHGTAGGLGPTFVDRGWPQGKDLALASATAGVTSAIVVGMILINWAARRGHLAGGRKPNTLSTLERAGIIPLDRRPSAGRMTVSSDAIGSLTFHLMVVGVAILIGYLLKEAAWLIEGMVNAGLSEKAREASALHIVVKSFPLFPLCMIGGLAVQAVEQRFDRHDLVDAGLTRRIQNAALDFLVIAAIATIRIQAVAEMLTPFLILVAAAIAWNVLCVVLLARRMLPDAWFERAIAEMGQSMGVTATGLLLLRVVDPDYETPAADAFASKQLLHEPFMGGGLWTSTAIPLLAIWGGLPVFLIAVGAVAMWLAIVFLPRVLRRGPAPAGAP
ncbi:MAG: sodium:glutamate symporter [Planctomycetes bacterium]|nr:sodium:glutamate symporter [Planctomycetota bacterium]